MGKNLAIVSNAEIEQYELLVPLLRAMYDEIKELSKKKPDGSLNKFKVDKINRILLPLKERMKNEPVCQYLDVLDEETPPFNSDAVLVLREYSQASRMFSDKYKHDVSEGFDFDMKLSTTREWNRSEK